MAWNRLAGAGMMRSILGLGSGPLPQGQIEPAEVIVFALGNFLLLVLCRLPAGANLLLHRARSGFPWFPIRIPSGLPPCVIFSSEAPSGLDRSARGWPSQGGWSLRRQSWAAVTLGWRVRHLLPGS